jgi:ferredoxin
MPDRTARLPENFGAPFYVDSHCVDCEVCRDIAPENFRRIAAKRYVIVFSQPKDSLQENLCREAMECCPVEAIGDDGQ